MEENKQSDIKIEQMEKSTEVKESSDSLVISQKGKNTRNIPAVLFIVSRYKSKSRKKLKNIMKNMVKEYTRK
jgi:hypothetical protein